MRDISIKSAKSTSRKQLQDSLELVRQGLVKPVISMSLPLEEAPRAHELVETGKAFGRVLLKP
jgi:D-arabinose 1-dehydrogenase-like Zn-dependent alcohol dehydrogenase